MIKKSLLSLVLLSILVFAVTQITKVRIGSYFIEGAYVNNNIVEVQVGGTAKAGDEIFFVVKMVGPVSLAKHIPISIQDIKRFDFYPKRDTFFSHPFPEYPKCKEGCGVFIDKGLLVGIEDVFWYQKRYWEKA